MDVRLTTRYERTGYRKADWRRLTGNPEAAPSDNLAAALTAMWRKRCLQALEAERYWRERCAELDAARLVGKLVVAGLMVLGCATAASAAGPTLNHCTFTWGYTGTELASFNVFVGTASGGPYTKVGTVPGSAATTYGPTANLCLGLPDGQKFAVVQAQDAAGNTSAWSNEVPFVFDATAPAAPTSLSVQ